MNKNLLILGAGMLGTVVKETVEEMGSFEKIDFLDDTFGMGENEGNYHEQSIGKLEDYKKFFPDYNYAFVAIGDPEIRMDWTKKLYYASYKIPLIVSKYAYISNSAQLGKGVFIGPKAVINPNAHIGEGSIVLANATVDHNTFVADYCNIQCGSVVMPCALVPNFTMTQPNEVIRRAQFSYTLERYKGELIFKGKQIEITTDGNVEG